MGKLEAARKTAKAIAVSTTPDVCKTPMGSSTPPIPYPIVGNFKDSASISTNVRFGGDPAFTLDKSTITKVTGDEAGSAGGVKSGSNKSIVKPKGASGKVRANGKRVVRHGDPVEMNKGNTKGKVVFQSTGGGGKGGGANPPVTPETAREAQAAVEQKGLWGRMSGYVHGALDVAGFIPGLGAIPDLANAGLFALEGNMVEAGISVVAAVPGVGDTIKGGKMAATAGKKALAAAGKKAEKELAERAAKEAAEKAATETGSAGKASAGRVTAGADNAHVSPKRKPKKYHRNKAERKKALKRDAADPSAPLDDNARDYIRETNGEKVPPGYEVSHEVPLKTAETIKKRKRWMWLRT